MSLRFISAVARFSSSWSFVASAITLSYVASASSSLPSPSCLFARFSDAAVTSRSSPSSFAIASERWYITSASLADGTTWP